MPTSENPSEQGSRGAEPGNLGNLWFKGPNGLSSTDKWPSQPEPCKISETTVDYKTKCERELLAKEEEKNCNVGQLLHKLFIVLEAPPSDCLCEEIYQHLREKIETKRKTEELQAAEKFWFAKAQAVGASKNKCKPLEERRSCDSRVRGYNPIYLPRESHLISMVVHQVLAETCVCLLSYNRSPASF